jgi:hypothetical protein
MFPGGGGFTGSIVTTADIESISHRVGTVITGIGRINALFSLFHREKKDINDAV